MAQEHPFQQLFETFGRPPIAHAELVNRRPYEDLVRILTVPVESPGRCISLRAKRAGHGKSHLLSRTQHFLGASHEFIPLHAAPGCRIDAESVIADTLRCLVRPLPASGGLCMLDMIARRLFALALQPLVKSGEVPCQDREGALSALRLRPVETFDFHHPNAVTAHWARENFEVLGQRLSMDLAQSCGLPVREVAFWVETLFDFASAPLDQSSRLTALADRVGSGSGREMERLEALLGLVTQLVRVVLVADEVEEFSADGTAALRFAAFIGMLRQSVVRLDVILSLNQDIWESAFLPRLSDGLADRLAERVVELEPLNEAEMVALLNSRTPGLGSQVLERIDIGVAGTHARGLIRAAGIVWMEATAKQAAEPVGESAAAGIPDADATQPPPIEVDQDPQPSPDPESEPLEEFALPQEEQSFTTALPAGVTIPDQEISTARPSIDDDLPDLESWEPLDGGDTGEDAIAFPEPAFDLPADDEASRASATEFGFPKAVQPDPTPDKDPAFQATEKSPESIAQPPPLPPFQGFDDSEPFQIVPPPFIPNYKDLKDPSEPVVEAAGNPPPPLQQEGNRVEDLLRKFRERYGRGSL